MKYFSSLFSTGLLALLLLALRLPAAAQAPAWQSAQAVAVATAASTSNFSDVKATAVDAAGNIFLAGSFSNTVVLGGTTLTSLGSNDVFVAKFSPASNQFVWAQRAGGPRDDVANALVVSGTSVYVAGNFSGPTAGFGATTLTNAGSFTSDLFVAKLTDAGSTGSFVWAQRAGGNENERANALAVSGTSVYVAGSFGSLTADFSPVVLTNTSTGSSDVFVAKLTDAGSTGSFVWAQQAGGTLDETAYALAVNGTSVYVTGNFASSPASFGPTTLINSPSNNPFNSPNSDAFIAKLTDTGNTGGFVWAQRAGGAGQEIAYTVAVNGSSIYATGYFTSYTVAFGSTNLTNAGQMGDADAFVTKLTDAGSTSSFVWAQRAGGISLESINALVISGNNVYVAGYFFSSTAAFGTTILTNTSPLKSEAFVAKLTDAGSTGSFVWAQRAGGAGNDVATAVAISSGGVYVAGYSESPTADFGTITLSNPNPGTTLGYLATLTDPTLTATTTSQALAAGQLYPNPAHGTATLRLPAGTAPAPLVLTDALGRAVRRYPAPASTEAVLDLSGLPAGLYLLRGAGLAQRLAVE